MTMITDDLLEHAANWWTDHLQLQNNRELCIFEGNVKETYKEKLKIELKKYRSEMELYGIYNLNLINLDPDVWMSTPLFRVAKSLNIPLSAYPVAAMEITSKGVYLKKNNQFELISASPTPRLD